MHVSYTDAHTGEYAVLTDVWVVEMCGNHAAYVDFYHHERENFIPRKHDMLIEFDNLQICG